MATFQNFGPFIFSYESLEQNELLLNYYMNFGRSDPTDPKGNAGGQPGQNLVQIAQVDNDTAYYCAYNFPAVLKTVGAQ